MWETCTPYFEKRNLHFYINVCAFYVTEYGNKRFKNSHREFDEEYEIDGSDDGDGMFAFRKEVVRKKPRVLPVGCDELV